MWFPQFVQPQKMTEMWAKQMEDQLVRAEAMGAQVEKLQSAGAERTRDAIDESAKLARASVDWAFEVSTAWRNASFEMTRKAMQAMTPPAPPKSEAEG